MECVTLPLRHQREPDRERSPPLYVIERKVILELIVGVGAAGGDRAEGIVG